MKENKTRWIHVRLTEAEYRTISKMAKPYGTITKFVRQYLLSDKKAVIDSKTFLQGMNELSVEVNRVGNNINQIAKFYNTMKDMDNYTLMREWLDVFSEYNLILNKVDLKYEEIFKKMFL
jgi:DNA-binding ferritin-like protein